MGPLEGVKVVEIASIGPGPWCAMMLSDMGAEVIRVDRADHVREQASGQRPADFVNRRGRRSVGVDLKNPSGAEVVLRLAERADALIEGSRPGVAERLGIGPDQCLERNPRLVYGRTSCHLRWIRARGRACESVSRRSS
jgi:alpha-methylacyl-CoA racemase